MQRLIPRTRRASLWRFALASVLVIAFAATATAVTGLLQFKQAAADFSQTPAIKNAPVVVPNPGAPQTILIIGSDHRAGTPFYDARTDTMMLVRLDPNSSTINVISIPRDLKVEIPEGAGMVTSKINASYSVGGPKLLEQVIQQNVFPALTVNHIVDVNFAGFQQLVNAIGCVYTDVDHRYYNDTAVTDYSSIDITPGYQKLCGTQALEFVRFRHTDSDIVRNARQQDFIRWAKDQYGVSRLISNKDTLLKIFGRNTETDHGLHTTDGLINLFNLVAFSAGHTIKQIPFPAVFEPSGPGMPSYVGADPTAEALAYQRFMAPTVAPAQPATKPAVTTAPAPATSAKGRRKHGAAPGPSPAALGLAIDPADGIAQAQALGSTSFPIYYPKLIDASASYCSTVIGNCYAAPNPTTVYTGQYPRYYKLHDQNRRPQAAYRMTLRINPALGEYYGVQGATWKNPPILDSPQATKVVHGKKLLLFLNGHHITLVGWKSAHGSYWISNSLDDAISNAAMVQLAGSLVRYRPPPPPPAAARTAPAAGTATGAVTGAVSTTATVP